MPRIAATSMIAIGLCCFTTLSRAEPDARITLHVDQPGVKVSPLLYGIFYEEINHAGDGGLYAELVQNRAFEELQPPVGARVEGKEIVTPQGFRHGLWYRDGLHAWSAVAEGGAGVLLHLDDANPLNPKTPHSLKMVVDAVGKRAGVANEGYWGMNVRDGAKYQLSFFARTEGDARQTITATLESMDGRTTYAKTSVDGVGGPWRRYTATLEASGNDPKARLALTVSRPGTIWFDVVSLFPPTFKDRPNGLRVDLATLLLEMKPAFMRFPGGCVVEGVTLENRIKWQNTIGPIEERPGRWDLWGYHNTEGLGFHEYLDLCEDLGAEPLYVTNAGLSCQFRRPEIAGPDKLQPFIDEMLDAIEYARGPVTSKWGALRAKRGHPAPFRLNYVEIGNENHGPAYDKNYAVMYRALKERWPDITAVADCPVRGAPLEIIDEHYYVAPEWFFQNAAKYDRYDRKGPKIYVGEYACNHGVGTGNLIAALSEAAFMTGMERNSDVVIMSSYAPLFENVNNRAWPVNLIRFDSSRSLGRTSYYVQKLFAVHRPDATVPVELAEADAQAPVMAVGGVGVGSWQTQAEFKDLRVVQGNSALLEPGFSNGTKGWKLHSGSWKLDGDVLRQSSHAENCFATAGNPGWHDYTFTLKARKVAGHEGFLILFLVGGPSNWVWWNVGGWGNSATSIEQNVHGAKQELTDRAPVRVETGRWYDVKIEVVGTRATCYLDGKKIQTADVRPRPRKSLFLTAGKSEKSGEVILKVVNSASRPITAVVKLDGAAEIGRKARVITLAGTNPTDDNTLEEPARIAPVESAFNGAGREFQYTFAPLSVTVLRLQTK